jgi:hypothetical protein
VTSTCARRQNRNRANPRDPGRLEPSLLALKSNGPHEAARAAGLGAVLLDGRMIDRPIVERARRWLAFNE